MTQFRTQSEVCYLDGVRYRVKGTHEDVCRLEVAVQNIVAVDVLQSLQYLFHYYPTLIFSEPLAELLPVNNEVGQRTALDELHDDEVMIVRLV